MEGGRGIEIKNKLKDCFCNTPQDILEKYELLEGINLEDILKNLSLKKIKNKKIWFILEGGEEKEFEKWCRDKAVEKNRLQNPLDWI